MILKRFDLDSIPAILWGEPSDRLYIYVHGKMSRKEAAEPFARLAEQKGFQTLSFDLPQHGERRDSAILDILTGIRDLNAAADYAFARRKHVSLFACSLGAYFSLQAYADLPLEKALFQSPVVDMAFLTNRMMEWFSVTPDELSARGVVDTPIHPLRWGDYRYILDHPVKRWLIPTDILYGGLDTMQTLEVMQSFAERFGARLTVSAGSEHPFMAPSDRKIAEAWLERTV